MGYDLLSICLLIFVSQHDSNAIAAAHSRPGAPCGHGRNDWSGNSRVGEFCDFFFFFFFFSFFLSLGSSRFQCRSSWFVCYSQCWLFGRGSSLDSPSKDVDDSSFWRQLDDFTQRDANRLRRLCAGDHRGGRQDRRNRG
jgi:hypothetical protein